MSASLRWEPIKPGRSLDVSAPSSFMAALERLTGQSAPWTFHADDLGALRGLAAGLTHEAKAMNNLIDAIETHGSIRVWAEY